MSDNADGTIPVLVEIFAATGALAAFSLSGASGLEVASFVVDPTYEPIPKGGVGALAIGQTFVIRGTISASDIPTLEARPDVRQVVPDVPVVPFACPSGFTCDCNVSSPNGTLADVTVAIGAQDVWASGFTGDGIIIGIVDFGILAVGLTPFGTVQQVDDGTPTDWGTIADSNEHGCMTATDALGIAPDARIFDIRIKDIGTALTGFQWAIDHHRLDGTPHVLSNSWGIPFSGVDPTYATSPTHVFTEKVEEAINEGILVLFAAGNCGMDCPAILLQCITDTGPGRSIWGANGHKDVMTVGAVNLTGDLAGYSSCGPAALDPNKPDFCSFTHFAGYFPTISTAAALDAGTSAATPVAAGVVALLKQARPDATQGQIKNCIRSTALDIGPVGWDSCSGSGTIQAKHALDCLLGL